MREKIFFYAAALFLASIPWQTRFIFRQGEVGGYASEYSTLSLYAADIFAIFWAAAFFYTYARGCKKPKSKEEKTKNSWLGAALFFGGTLFSVFWATDRLLALQHSYWVLLALTAAWILGKTPCRKKLLFVFLGSLLLSAWLGIWQFVCQKTFANKWLGLAAHDPLLGGSSVVELFFADGSITRFLRAYGSFDHPNIFGAYMAVGVLLSLFLWLESKGRKEKVFLGVSILSMTAGIFMSLSRSSWAGFSLGMLFFAAGKLDGKLSSKKDFFAAAGQISAPLILVLGMFTLLGVLYPAQVFTRSAATGRLEEKSLSERALYVAQGEELAAENFPWGTGAGNYTTALQKKYPAFASWQIQPVHNVPILVWAELGVPGLLLLIALVLSLLKVALPGKMPSLTLLAVLIPVFFLDHWLWSLHSGLILLGLIGGLLPYNWKKVDLSVNARTC